jgi:hypothetical protein
MSHSVLADILANQKVLQLPILRGRKDPVVVAYALVRDDNFGRSLKKRVWRLDGHGYPKTYVKLAGGRIKILTLHHIVYRRYHGHLPDGKEVDHRDRDPLNSLPTNLRAVTRSFNTANGGTNARNSSGFKCVFRHRDKRSGRQTWRARVSRHRKCVVDKTFPGTEQGWRDAAKEVNRSYETHFPEIAVPNPDWATKPYPF